MLSSWTRSCLRNPTLNIAWIVCRDTSRHSTPASSRESTPRSKRKQSWSLKKSLLDSGSSLKAREAEMERLRSYQARVPSLDPDCTTEPSLSENDVSSSQTSGQLVCFLNKLLQIPTVPVFASTNLPRRCTTEKRRKSSFQFCSQVALISYHCNNIAITCNNIAITLQ